MLVGSGHGLLRAVLFDLDETLIAGAGAWAYALEQAVLSVVGRRVDALPLASAYRRRPWEHAVAVVLATESAQQRRECAALCEQMAARSAMKRLLVHEGIGMALDQLRADRVELGGLSRLPHPTALKQVQSTGLDRFLAVLSATPPGERWDVVVRASDCLAFLGEPPEHVVFVSAERTDLARMAGAGFPVLGAAWANDVDDQEDDSRSVPLSVAATGDLPAALRSVAR